MRANAVVHVVMLATLASCAPRSAPYALQTLSQPSGAAFIAEFKDKFDALTITLNGAGVEHYAGDDARAFEWVIDRFYQSNPGYCPLERGFMASSNGKRFVTVVGKTGTLELRAFAYDLGNKPQITFAHYAGTSRVALKVRPCRTVGLR